MSFSHAYIFSGQTIAKEEEKKNERFLFSLFLSVSSTMQQQDCAIFPTLSMLKYQTRFQIEEKVKTVR